MTGRTIADTYTTGISLTNPSDNPVTVLSSGSIAYANGVALQASTGTDWTIGNAGTIEATGTTAGDTAVLLLGGGVVTNLSSGAIGGYDIGVSITGTGSVVNYGRIGASQTGNPPGYSYNSTTGVFIPLSAGAALGGGGVSNAASAIISGYFEGVAVGGDGSVVNAGTIAGRLGVVLTSGGSVSNASTGTITSGSYSVLALGTNVATVVNQGLMDGTNGGALELFRGGTVNNSAGTIVAATYGLRLSGTVASAVTNTGTIIGTSGSGVGLFAGGSLSNSGLITGGRFGVGMGGSIASTLINSGSIHGDQKSGVYMVAGGYASNASTGTIDGGYFGIQVLGTLGSVVNAGSIFSVQAFTGGSFDAAGVDLAAGGTVSNASTGHIDATWKGVEIGTTTTNIGGTVLNDGYIHASNSNGSTGAGVWIHGPAMISNSASGTIAGGPFAIVVYNATTLVNDGRISAVAYNSGTPFAFDVVNPGYVEQVIVAPGATFAGEVSGGNTIGSSVVSTLEFTGGSQAGSLYGIGSHYVDFGQISIDSGASWQLTGYNSLAASGTLTNSGHLTLSGAILIDSGALTNNGSIVLDPSLLTVTALTGNGAVTIQTGSTLDSKGIIAAGETIAFTGTSGLLQLEAPGSASGSVVGFAQGDTIDLSGVDPASVHYADGVLSFTAGGNATEFQLALADKTVLLPAVSDGAGGAEITAAVTCFRAGTRIATPHGDVPVEHLAVGDLVCVLHPDGERTAQPVVWLGYRAVHCARHPDPRKVWPVRIAAGALGSHQPRRDLYVSPDHAIFVDGVLIPVKYLINRTTIIQVPTDNVDYYHIELPRHCVVQAEGLAVESYLETGARHHFANGGSAVSLHPDFTQRIWDAEACAPLVVTGPHLEAALRQINAHAAALTRARRTSAKRTNHSQRSTRATMSARRS